MSIQGQFLEITFVGWDVPRQDAFVRIEYGSSKFRTRNCRDPEKFKIPLIEGLRELEISVGNSTFFKHDDHVIGTGRVELDKVLSEGYDDSSWPIQTRNSRSAGNVKLIMHYSGSSGSPHNPPPNPYVTPYVPPPPFVYPPNIGGYYYPPQPPYPGAGYAPYPPYGQAYPPPSAAQPPYQYPPQGPYPGPGAYPPPY